MRESAHIVLVLSVYEAKLFLRKTKSYLRNVKLGGVESDKSLSHLFPGDSSQNPIACWLTGRRP